MPWASRSASSVPADLLALLTGGTSTAASGGGLAGFLLAAGWIALLFALCTHIGRVLHRQERLLPWPLQVYTVLRSKIEAA
jgi:hypothetical protein